MQTFERTASRGEAVSAGIDELDTERGEHAGASVGGGRSAKPIRTSVAPWFNAELMSFPTRKVLASSMSRSSSAISPIPAAAAISITASRRCGT